MQITAGTGPDQCCWVVARIIEKVLKDASANGYTAHILETIAASNYDIFKSALIAIEGPDIPSFVAQWAGTIQWIGKSIYRTKHKRNNWFVGVSFFQLPKAQTINDRDLKFDKMRSSGPGGQHANKTESAIRVTHIPTGTTAIAQEERSQHLNRKLALSRLYKKLKQNQQENELDQQHQRWNTHNTLERGNPVRVYQGPDFKIKTIRKT